MPRGARPWIVTAEVQTELRFDEYKRAVEISVNRALVKGAAIMKAEIRAAETRVSSTAMRPKGRPYPGLHLRDTLRLLPVGLNGGFGTIVVWTPDPNAIWQELGTRERRRRGLARGGVSVARGAVSSNVNVTGGNRGVTPLYFMHRGFAAAKPQIEALIVRALGTAGEFGGSELSVGARAGSAESPSSHFDAAP